jgi:predicted Zn-dependent protease
VYVDDAFTNYEIQMIEHAITKWQRATNEILQYRIVRKFPHIDITTDELPKHSDGVWIYRGSSKVREVNKNAFASANLSSIHINMDKIYLYEPSDITLQATVMHEIGHTVGIGHISDANSLMNPGCEAACLQPTITMYDLNAFCNAAKRGYTKLVKE